MDLVDYDEAVYDRIVEEYKAFSCTVRADQRAGG
jgi:sulfate adenylyltransferase subunit 1 (EFTu-like GTPase family)